MNWGGTDGPAVRATVVASVGTLSATGTVTVSTGPLASITVTPNPTVLDIGATRQFTDSLADVEVLIPQGADAHEYEPSPLAWVRNQAERYEASDGAEAVGDDRHGQDEAGRAVELVEHLGPAPGLGKAADADGDRHQADEDGEDEGGLAGDGHAPLSFAAGAEATDFAGKAAPSLRRSEPDQVRRVADSCPPLSRGLGGPPGNAATLAVRRPARKGEMAFGGRNRTG